MSDIDYTKKTFDSIARAKQKAFLLRFFPFILWYILVVYLHVIQLWDLIKAIISTSPILIILYPLFHFKGWSNKYYFLTDKEMDFLNDWNEFQVSKTLDAWEKWRKENR